MGYSSSGKRAPLQGLLFAALLILTSLGTGGCLRIRPRPCSNALGEQGTCMFVLECLNSDGKHLGTCMDDFFFGSCCAHNDAVNALDTDAPSSSSSSSSSGGEPNEIDVIPVPPPPPSNLQGSSISVTSALSVSTRPPVPPQTTRWTTMKPHTFKPYRPRPTLSPTQFDDVIAPWTTTPSTTTSTTTTTTTVPSTASTGQWPVDRGCGRPVLHPQTKVVGGKNSAFGAWPWQVSVRRTSFFGFSSTHRCGGAILNSQWIATAGHCVDDLLLSQIRIRVGEYDFSSLLEPYPYVERSVVKKVVHPSYNFFTYENDLALVKVDDSLDFNPHIGPICLPPDEDSLVGRNATVTGWGRLSEGGVLPSVLQEVQVPIVSNDKCKNMFLAAGRHEYIPEIFMCAGYENGGRDSCQGDSGGPLQVQGEDGRWFLAGIISWGIGCAEPNLPGVCTRISKFKDWILRNIA